MRVLLLFVGAGETHDDQHSVCSLLDKAVNDRRVLREGFDLSSWCYVGRRAFDVKRRDGTTGCLTTSLI